jgi:anti-sigma factor RsiW
MRKALAGVMPRNRRRCEDARALMSDYVEGDIDPAARRRLERHLRFCHRCHVVLGNLRLALAQVRALRGRQPPGADAEAAARLADGWRERT